MKKPLSLIINEFKTSIFNIIRDSKLPVCVVKPIISELLNELASLEQKEYELDFSKYSENKEEKDV